MDATTALQLIGALGGLLAPVITAMIAWTIRRERMVERRLSRIEARLGLNGG